MSDANAAMQGKSPCFFARVKAELGKLFVHVPGWEASAAATLTYLAPMVEAVLAVAEPGAVPAVTALIERIQSAMAAAAVLIKTAGPHSTLTTYLNAVKNDAGELLAAAGFKDPALISHLTGIVTAITAEVDAILGEVDLKPQASKAP